MSPRPKFFLDTEFYEDGSTIDLISIAVVTEDTLSPELYACNRDAKLHRCGEWHREHVLPKLPPYARRDLWLPREEIALRLRAWVTSMSSHRPCEFWAYYAATDWVALYQLYGPLVDLPDAFPKVCHDLKLLSVLKGSPRHPPKPEGQHDALADARWNRDLYRTLASLPWPVLEPTP